ncbi:Fe-Mn family superoxide dismutase [Fischerella thermalis]|uniref:Fe-Mn family superoxide dismutase n=1 Tax=Fischerella thermalis TaxID=372787 RepID=UPI00215508EC|nr:Fe-Mn family superoxide dismutase [Fischerella thermalis]
MKQFGGDWVWLVFNPEHKLQIVTTSNQNSLLSIGLYPLLGNDVWEHTSSIHSLTSVINLCNFMQLYFLY